MDWFYVQNGKQIGPVPVAQFDELVRSGRITAGTLIWREGLANWQPFGSIPSKGSPLPSPPEPPPLAGTPPSVPGVRIGCAECGLTFPQSEMIPFARSWICAQCKPIFLQRLREGAPLAAGGAEAWQNGDAVVTLHGGKLPLRCVRCNGAVTGTPIERVFYWHSDWVYLLLFIPPIYLIVYFVVSKRARVSLPICEKCRRRRQIFIGVSWFFVALGMATIFAGGIYDSGELCGLALAMFLVAMFLGLSKGMLVSTNKVNPHYIWMRGFGKEYRESLPEFPELG